MDRIRIITSGTTALQELVFESQVVAPHLHYLGHSSVAGELYELLVRYRPHVVVVEIVNDFAASLAIIGTINSRYSASTTFVIAHKLDVQEIQAALRSGAMAYLQWPVAVERLISAIQLVHEGKMALSAEALALLFPT